MTDSVTVVFVVLFYFLFLFLRLCGTCLFRTFFARLDTFEIAIIMLLLGPVFHHAGFPSGAAFICKLDCLCFLKFLCQSCPAPFMSE